MTDSQSSFVVTDPRTGRPRRQVTDAGSATVSAAVARARNALSAWASLTAAARSRRLLKLARLIEDNAAEFALAEQAGTGKPWGEAESEVAQTVDVLTFYAGALRAELSPGAGQRLPGRESWVRWEPLGVVAAIVPWNYPLLMAAWRLGPALAAGNTVVLKPAQTTPDSAELLAAYADEALGEDVLTTVTGGRETGRLLVRSPVDAIAFTGSNAGGQDVATQAGLRPVSLELGGNCPALVLPDAPDYTFDQLVGACVYNAGQSCASPARVITLPENYTETVDRLEKAMAAKVAGVDFGPLNNIDQLARFDRIIGESTAAREHTGQAQPNADESQGYWRPGRILADLPDGDAAVVEEVFGPVLTVQAAPSVDDAVRLANGMPQALAASVWGSAGKVLDLAGRLDAGEVWVNCHLEQTAELPHGGRRQSGNGTDLSVLALSEYQRPKTVTVRLD
jgi:betaine-aldehyde dehydrogenase